MWLRDLSGNGKLIARGRDRVRFLNGMFTNDVAKLAAGTGCRAAMLTVKGKLLGEVLLLGDEDAIVIELEGALKDKIRGQLDRHLFVDEVEIEDGSAVDEIGVYAATAAEARAAVEQVTGPLPDLPPLGHLRRGDTRVVRTLDRDLLVGLPGYRLIGGARALADALAARGATLLDDAEAERRRIEAGVPRYGLDMGEDHLPMEARLDDAIAPAKGCYMGQEVIARATARGHINRRLMGLRLDGDRPAAPGAKLRGLERPDAGVVTSSVVSPRLGAIALGYVHRSLWAPGTALEVLEDGGPRRALVGDLPFVSS